MKIGLLLLSTLLLVSTAQSQEALNLNRRKVVELALTNNETYQSALMEKDRIKGQYLEARAGAFPKLDFSAYYLRNIDLQVSPLVMTNEETGEETRFSVGMGTAHNYNFGLTLTQPLYAAGKVGAAIKIAKYGFSYTDEGIRASRLTVATMADRAYLDALAARATAEVYREAERLADSSLAVVEKLYEQGHTSEFDLLRAQVTAANRRPDRIAAVNNARLALDYLRNLLALPHDVELNLEDEIEPVAVPDLNLDELVIEAQNNRPDLKQSEELVNIRDKQISIEKSGYLPSVDLSSTIGWDNYANDFSKSQLGYDYWTRSWNVMVLLKWNIFSGLETTGRTRQARVDYYQSRLDNSQLKRQVGLEVREAVSKVEEAGERVESLGQTVKQAEKSVDIALISYQNGVGTQLELLDAQVGLTQARVNRITAVHDLAVSVTELRQAVGREWDIKW